MPIVQSFGALREMSPLATWSSGGGGSVSLFGRSQSYAGLYAAQPNIRICVDFLARNLAPLGLHWYRREGDTDRVRLTDHDLARWLSNPNPSTTPYRLIESLMGDLGIYFNAYWMKVRYVNQRGERMVGLVRLPPEEMAIEGSLLPSRFIWTRNGQKRPFETTEIVHFNGYNPLNPLKGLSPLDTLRDVLAEQGAAFEHRAAYWRNAGRMEGVIEQSKDAPNWTTEQKNEFRQQWGEFSQGGARVGQTALLPKGMTIKQWSFTARDSEYTAARKLSREECAAAYHIPLPMVGILEHATYSNIREQHRHLYADSLGPWMRMIEAEIERQLLPESGDTTGVYCEFNIAEKLKGAFEEQSASLQTLIGRPIMTPNEGRARLNLPRMADDPSADEIAPQQGGPASSPVGATRPLDLSTDDRVALELAVRSTWDRQVARLGKLPPHARARALSVTRSTRELAADLQPILGAAAAFAYAESVTQETYTRIVEGRDPAAPDREVP